MDINSPQTGLSADDLVSSIVKNSKSMDNVWALDATDHTPLIDGIVQNASEIRTVADEILASARTGYPGRQGDLLVPSHGIVDIPAGRGGPVDQSPKAPLTPSDVLVYPDRNAPLERVPTSAELAGYPYTEKARSKVLPTEAELGLYVSEPVSLPPLKPFDYRLTGIGQTTNLEHYLLAGGDINAKNADGMTPIEVAISVGNPDDVLTILEQGGFDPRGIDISEPARMQKLYGDIRDYRRLAPLIERFEAMKAVIEKDATAITPRGNIIPADYDPMADVADATVISQKVGTSGIQCKQDSIDQWMAPQAPVRRNVENGPSLG